MKKLLLYTVFLFVTGLGYGQNLVPNAGFEIYDTCPDFASQIRYTTTWFDANTGTSDYYNSCASPAFVGVPLNQFGYQNARSGNAYAGFMISDAVGWSINYREYIEVKLNDSLVPGTKYYLSFYVSLADSSVYATDDIGVYFSMDSLKNDTSFDNFSVIPQIENQSGNILTDKANWMQIKGSYTALGGEKYITIGNFKDTSSTTFITIPGGGSSTTYDFPYYYIDDVCLSTDSLLCSIPSFINDYNRKDKILIYPNPADNYINLTLPFAEASDDVFIVFYYTGIEAFRCNIFSNHHIDVSQLPAGMYYCQLQHKNEKYSSKIIIKR